jgi:hypothetical protein
MEIGWKKEIWNKRNRMEKKNEHYIHKDCKKKKLGKCEVNNFNTEIIKNILLFFIVHTSASVKF